MAYLGHRGVVRDGLCGAIAFCLVAGVPQKGVLMKSTRACLLVVTFLLVTGAGIAARVDRWFMCWPGNRAKSFNPLDVFIGEGQKMFATHFYRKADVYFHRGGYPTIFDNTESYKTSHVAEDAGATDHEHESDEHNFLSDPLDIIDRFNRNFFPSKHTELGEDFPGAPAANPDGKDGDVEVREILPWLRAAAALDPEMPETYTVTAYWLRRKLGKVKEAELFLREGLRNVPGNPAILFELGRIYFENHKDPTRARNLWRQGVTEWQRQEAAKREPDRFIFAQLQGNLAKLEEQEGNLAEAIAHWELIESTSPASATIQAKLAELRKIQASGPPPK
jgi:tetratricopeptide (TPR) repeat protein